MKREKTEKNLRQYERMRAVFPDSWNRTSLGATISTLEFLLEAIEECDQDWKCRFQKQWGILEEVNAFVLDEGRPDFSNGEQTLIERAAESLKALIEDAESALTKLASD